MEGQNISHSFREKYEQELNKISQGLQKPRLNKKRNAVHQRIGRPKGKYQYVAAHYPLDLKLNLSTDTVTGLTWEYQRQPASKQIHPGIYQLKTTLHGLG